jgi:hypothetical protein
MERLTRLLDGSDTFCCRPSEGVTRMHDLSDWAMAQLKQAYNALLHETASGADVQAATRHAARIAALVDRCQLAGSLPAQALGAGQPYVDHRQTSAWIQEYRMTVHEIEYWRRRFDAN